MMQSHHLDRTIIVCLPPSTCRCQLVGVVSSGDQLMANRRDQIGGLWKRATRARDHAAGVYIQEIRIKGSR